MMLLGFSAAIFIGKNKPGVVIPRFNDMKQFNVSLEVDLPFSTDIGVLALRIPG
jgi:hypothetical protein